MKISMGIKSLQVKMKNKRQKTRPLAAIFAGKNKKAVSGVITVLILIALSLAVISIVWAVISNLVKKQIESTESCFGVFEKVTINGMYTCHDSSLNNFQFSINIGDIDVDEVLVSVSKEGTTESYKINNTLSIIPDLGPYPSGAGSVKLPEKNAGLTYIAGGFSEKPNLIQIAPVINEKQCGVSDSLYEIDDCLSLV